MSTTSVLVDPSDADRGRRIYRAFHLVTVASILIAIGLLALTCALQRSEDPRIWFLLLLGPAGMAIGTLVGFVYAAFGEERESFSPVITALNGVLGGAAAADLAQDDSALVGFFSMVAESCALPDGGGLVLLVLLTFAGIGFLTGYINKKLILNLATAIQDRAIRDVQAQAKDEKQARSDTGTGGKRKRRTERETAPNVAVAHQDIAIRDPERGAESMAVPPATVSSGEDDPQKGRWGGSPINNGRQLSATVKPAVTDRDNFLVELEVRSTDSARPLTGRVTFHLHPTFKDPLPEVTVVNGIAQLKVLAWGAFTVGAETDGGATRLELDLAELADAPQDFRAR